jgi:hypothetical protein
LCLGHGHAPPGRRPGEGGNGQDGSIHVLLMGKIILSLLEGKDFGMDGDALCLGHGHAPPGCCRDAVRARGEMARMVVFMCCWWEKSYYPY